jgi:hypothetical protein
MVRKKHMKGVGHGLKVRALTVPLFAWRNCIKPRKNSKRVEIRTGHFTNIYIYIYIALRYRYTRLFGCKATNGEKHLIGLAQNGG